MAEGLLVFDGECGFCTRSVGWLHRLDRGGRVAVRPLQEPGAADAVGATVGQCRESVRWLGSDGRARAGAEAVNAALAVVAGTRLPLWLYGPTAGLQERVYDWVAANRHRLPGTTPHCAAHPGSCSGG